MKISKNVYTIKEHIKAILIALFILGLSIVFVMAGTHFDQIDLGEGVATLAYIVPVIAVLIASFLQPILSPIPDYIIQGLHHKTIFDPTLYIIIFSMMIRYVLLLSLAILPVFASLFILRKFTSLKKYPLRRIYIWVGFVLFIIIIFSRIFLQDILSYKEFSIADNICAGDKICLNTILSYRKRGDIIDGTEFPRLRIVDIESGKSRVPLRVELTEDQQRRYCKLKYQKDDIDVSDDEAMNRSTFTAYLRCLNSLNIDIDSEITKRSCISLGKTGYRHNDQKQNFSDLCLNAYGNFSPLLPNKFINALSSTMFTDEMDTEDVRYHGLDTLSNKWPQMRIIDHASEIGLESRVDDVGWNGGEPGGLELVITQMPKELASDYQEEFAGALLYRHREANQEKIGRIDSTKTVTVLGIPVTIDRNSFGPDSFRPQLYRARFSLENSFIIIETEVPRNISTDKAIWIENAIIDLTKNIIQASS